MVKRPPRKASTKSSTRTASAKPAAAPPFFGQGHAEYYEWFEMWILFDAPVPKAERKALLKGAPRPAVLDAQWPHSSLLWASTGDQWIHQHLVEAYGTPAAKAKMKKALARQEAGDDDDDLLDDLLAMGGEEKKFNAEIEQWILAMHKKRPILLVARQEDGEAGGTRLGAWHKKSVAQLEERVLPALQALAKQKVPADDLRRAPIEIVVEYVGAKRAGPAVAKLARRPDEALVQAGLLR